jgi:hypothetical protein
MAAAATAVSVPAIGLPIIAGVAGTILAVDAAILTGQGISAAFQGASGACKTLTAPRPVPPPKPPSPQELLQRAIRQAQDIYQRELQIAEAHADPDEREAYAAGALARYREKLARLAR